MKISVCIATYNGEKYIKEQLSSILIQLKDADEVIISDDNSTDYTLNIINSINDSRVKVFKNQKCKGYTKNFENALEKASGDIIFLSDQDDVWLPNKVVVMLNELNKYDFVVSDNIIVDSQLNTLFESHYAVNNTQPGFLRNLLLPRYVGACMAFRRNVLDMSLPFPDNSKLCAHDYWISLIAELYFSARMTHQPLILYRRHDSNASTGGNKSKNTLCHKIKVRLYTLYHLLCRKLR
ncbi:glycosyltransferase family 2 protein [[Pasteurella] aerogenes]|nr:glycosyltransferase family 2 protein [[Pasteurella] aerogenes]